MQNVFLNLDCFLKIGRINLGKHDTFQGLKCPLKSVLFITVAGWKIAFLLKVNCFIKPEAALLADVLENKNTFFTEHLRTTASIIQKQTTFTATEKQLFCGTAFLRQPLIFIEHNYHRTCRSSHKRSSVKNCS